MRLFYFVDIDPSSSLRSLSGEAGTPGQAGDHCFGMRYEPKGKEKSMSSKTPVSNARDYTKIGAFWDTHDATEWGEETPVDFIILKQHIIHGLMCIFLDELRKS